MRRKDRIPPRGAEAALVRRLTGLSSQELRKRGIDPETIENLKRSVEELQGNRPRGMLSRFLRNLNPQWREQQKAMQNSLDVVDMVLHEGNNPEGR